MLDPGAQGVHGAAGVALRGVLILLRSTIDFFEQAFEEQGEGVVRNGHRAPVRVHD